MTKSQMIDTYGEPMSSLLKNYRGCCRYITSNLSSGKLFTHAQAVRIHGESAWTITNFEDTATNAKGGTAQGTKDAKFATGYAKNTLKQPTGTLIVYSVDYEVLTSAQMSTVIAYFRAIKAVHKPTGYLVGAYGSYKVVTALLAAGVIDLAWQCAAWSYGKKNTDKRTVLFQSTYTPGYDVNQILQTFIGAWTPSGAQPNPSAVKPKPVPATHSLLGDDEMTMIFTVQRVAGKTWPGVFLSNGVVARHIVNTAELAYWRSCGFKDAPHEMPLSVFNSIPKVAA